MTYRSAVIGHPYHNLGNAQTPIDVAEQVLSAPAPQETPAHAFVGDERILRARLMYQELGRPLVDEVVSSVGPELTAMMEAQMKLRGVGTISPRHASAGALSKPRGLLDVATDRGLTHPANIRPEAPKTPTGPGRHRRQRFRHARRG